MIPRINQPSTVRCCGSNYKVKPAYVGFFVCVVLFAYWLNQPTTAKIAPLVPIDDKFVKSWKTCKNDVTQDHLKAAEEAVKKRMAWGKEYYNWDECKSGESCQHHDAFMIAPQLTDEKPLEGNPSRFVRRVRGGNLPLNPWAKSHWDRFDMMGPEVFHCENLKAFGVNVDEERRMCWRDEYDTEDCTIFSVGSNNQYEFEESVAALSKNCKIHTFDCTVDVPRVPEALKSRITFHKLCLGSEKTVMNGMKFDNLAGFVKLTGGKAPTLLKMDIEGWEWPALLDIIYSAEAHKKATGEDIFPSQIAIEMHYGFLPWSWGQFTSREILAYFNRIFYEGGYVLGYRRDNIQCYHCTEILLAKVKC